MEKRQAKAKAYNEECCYVFEDQPFWSDNQGITSGRRVGLCLYRRSTGRLTWITEPYFNVVSMHCDEKRVLFAGESYTGSRLKLHGLYLYSVETGETRCLIEPGTREVGTSVLWGDRIFLTAKPVGVHEDTRMYKDMFLLSPQS